MLFFDSEFRLKFQFSLKEIVNLVIKFRFKESFQSINFFFLENNVIKKFKILNNFREYLTYYYFIKLYIFFLNTIFKTLQLQFIN